MAEREDQSPFFIRTTTPADIPACCAIDVAAWGPDAAAPEAWLRERLHRYPAGNFVAIERATGRIVGTVWTVRKRWDHPFTTWYEASGNGAYEGVFDPFGDTIFGVNHSVPPEYRGRQVGMLLATRVAEMAWMFGMKRAAFGCPVPEYHRWAGVFRIEDYVHMVRDEETGTVCFRDPATDVLHQGPPVSAVIDGGDPIDPRSWPVAAQRFTRWDGHLAEVVPTMSLDGELAYFMGLRVRGQPCKVFRALPGYFPDPNSLDNGVLIGWDNPEHPDRVERE